jgi:ferredoxin
MAPILYYYTGTGNSLWVARNLASHLAGANLVSMAGRGDEVIPDDCDLIGLVFPVYIWGVPAPIVRFIEGLHGARPGLYCFAVAVNGGQVSNTLVELRGVLKKKGITLSSGFEMEMPSNYIPWGGPGPKDEQEKRFGEAKTKIERIAGHIRNRGTGPIEKGPLWQRLVFTFIHNISYDRVPKMDGKFWVDEKCNRCGICAKVCPAGNITLDDGKPSWNHRCEQCLACIQWCPKQSIQYGKKTPLYERYHHPEINLKDVLKSGQT